MKNTIYGFLAPTRVAGIFLGMALSNPLLGQSPSMHMETGERWYQVEMIVFSQGPGPHNTEEVWRTDIDLDYPRDWVELIDPAEPAVTPAEGGSPSQSVEITPLPETGAQGVADADSTKPDEHAFVLLPEEQLTLRGQARRLNRSRQHRVLFHEGWLQPMVENREEPSILITGGDRFDRHHELEGSINLYLGTYLHIELNLWLSRFATNFGQERPPWPALPSPPNQLLEAGTITAVDDAGTGLLWRQSNEADNDQYSAILAQPYVVENVVLMNQQRRMRSSELHYLDHPLLGVLVKLVPYEQKAE